MLALLAQTTSSSDAVAGTAAAGIFGGLIFVWVIVGLVFLAFFIWWIVLLMDCIKRDFPEKNTWLIVLIVGWLFGFVWLVDLLYYFMIVKKYGKANGGGNTTPPSQPAQPVQK